MFWSDLPRATAQVSSCLSFSPLTNGLGIFNTGSSKHVSGSERIAVREKCPQLFNYASHSGVLEPGPQHASSRLI